MINRKILLCAGLSLIIITAAGCSAVPTSTQAPLPITVDSAVPAIANNPAVETANMLNSADSLISVQSVGEFKAKPDVAYVDFAVETQNINAKTALEQNKKKIDDVLSALKAGGIADKDIQTLRYGVYPQYNYTNGAAKLTGYSVSNSVKVTINEVDKVGEKLDAIVNAGATNINNVYFGLKDITAAQGEAIKDAVKKSGISAKAICDASGLKVGDVVHIQYGSYSSQPYYYADNLDAVKEQAAVTGGAGAPTVIESGDIPVEAALTILYKFTK